MSFLSFNQGFNQNTYSDKDVLSAFRQKNEKSKEIKQGMSPTEISEVISDSLMVVIKEQFETIKKEFDNKELINHV